MVYVCPTFSYTTNPMVGVSSDCPVLCGGGLDPGSNLFAIIIMVDYIHWVSIECHSMSPQHQVQVAFVVWYTSKVLLKEKTTIFSLQNSLVFLLTKYSPPHIPYRCDLFYLYTLFQFHLYRYKENTCTSTHMGPRTKFNIKKKREIVDEWMRGVWTHCQTSRDSDFFYVSRLPFVG